MVRQNGSLGRKRHNDSKSHSPFYLFEAAQLTRAALVLLVMQHLVDNVIFI